MGGGLALQAVASTTITNAVFWNNNAPIGPEIGDNGLLFASELSVQYSDLKGGQSSIEVNPGCILYFGDGMIDSDPLFVDPAQRDYHLKQEPCHPGDQSPCVDTGDPNALFGGTTRIDKVRDIYPVDMGSHHPPDSPLEIHVSGKYASIQNAINATWDGDTVIVSPGTYVENIDFKGNAIHVKSSDGAAVTEIDGGMPIDPESGSVVTFTKCERMDSVLEGFTLKNGRGTLANLNTLDSWYYGGGICCISSSPSLRNNVVIGNFADYGGGLYCYHGDPVVDNNILSENSGVYEGGGVCSFEASPTLVNNEISHNSVTNGPGGGISCTEETQPTIENNTITGNTAKTGGGIHCLTNCDAALIGNTVADNTAEDQGGGLFIIGSRPTVTNNFISNNSAQYGSGISIWTCYSIQFENNTISENTASQRGGGIHFVNSYISKIRNNTISRNTAKAGGGISCSDSNLEIGYNTIWGNSADSGGGLYIVNDSQLEVVNTILSKNSAAQGPEIEIRGGFHASSLIITYSDLEGGAAMVYADPDCYFDYGMGMIDVDPILVDPENGDFHLSYLSSCRGSGYNSASFLLPTDFEGDPRISQEVTDMGADEYHTHLYCIGDFSPGGFVEGKFIGTPGTFPVALFIGSGVMDPPLHHMWGDFYLEWPWMLLPLFPIPPEGVLVVSDTLPGSPAGPYDIPLQALIGESFTNLFVLEIN